MSLTLEIVGPQAAQLGAAARKTFFNEGGSIGRANVNDWVIPDAYVSGQHARVHFLEGRYFLEDLSTNGVFIKNPGNRLPKGQRYPLQSGDRVFIDAYEIKVTIDGQNKVGESSQPNRPSPFDSMANQHSVVPTAAIERPKNGHDKAESEGIPVELTIPLPEPSDAVADAIASGELPVDFDPFGEPDAAMPPPAASSPKKPGKKPAKPQPVADMDDDPMHAETLSHAGDLKSLLAAAGIPQSAVTPEISENFAQILHVVIAGIMGLLRERERIRQEFGIRNTMYKKADNNPLKFSVNVEDALHNLLVKRNAAYLAPIEAFQDAFKDLRDHETVMLQAMRAAFNAMLDSFSPDVLQVSFNKVVKHGALWSGPIKLRYWELYRDRYKDLTKDVDQCFRELFADEFVRAYTTQLERLRRSHDT